MSKKLWVYLGLLVISVGTLSTWNPMVSDKVSEQEKAFIARQAELERKMNAKGTVVYAVKEIPEGTVFKADQMKEAELAQSKIPQDAITSPSLAIGLRANYDIGPGMIISQHDLARSKPSKKE